MQLCLMLRACSRLAADFVLSGTKKMTMRQLLAVSVAISLAAALPCHAQREQTDLSVQVKHLNSILTLLVRAEVVSQRLTLDRAELQELFREREKVDADMKAALSFAFTEAQLAELETQNPELARNQRAVLSRRELHVVELRSKREIVEGNIGRVKSRIDTFIRRLDAIEQRLDILSLDTAFDDSTKEQR